MPASKPAKPEPEVHVHDPSNQLGKLKLIGGSMCDDWNNFIASQVSNCLWLKHSGAEDARRQRHALVDMLIGIKPRDEFEGMLVAQLIACHNASMECYRRAMVPEQAFEVRQGNLNQANKLSRTCGTLLETLNRHRGKGRQTVRVEHVHVHEGGQAIVGNVESRGGGSTPKPEEQPHALAYAPIATMPRTDAAREPVSVTGHEERSM